MSFIQIYMSHTCDSVANYSKFSWNDEGIYRRCILSICPLWEPRVDVRCPKKVWPKVSYRVPEPPKDFTDKEILMVSGM